MYRQLYERNELFVKHYLGIDVGGTDIKVGVVREDYKIIAKHSVPTNHPRPPGETIADMVAAGKAALKMAGLSETDIPYVGIGLPGVLDSNKNRIVYANNLDWYDVDLIPIFKEMWDIPVYLVNDADAAALAEVYAGAAREYDSSITITLGTGVGGGLYFNKQIYKGGDGLGTEPGHIIIVADGELCTCGARGCFEAYASVTGLIRDAVRAMENHPDSVLHELCGGDTSRVDGRIVFEAANRGDAAGKLVVENYIGYVATGIASLFVLLRPQAFILGGGVCNAGETLFGPLHDEVVIRSTVTGNSGVPPILKAELGNDAGIIGAALIGI
jgi:glucokinase